jgi:hypothetical protein
VGVSALSQDARKKEAHLQRAERSRMSKLTLLAVLGLIYIGVVRLAYFTISVFFILFFGMSVWELIRTVRQPVKHPFVAQ